MVRAESKPCDMEEYNSILLELGQNKLQSFYMDLAQTKSEDELQRVRTAVDNYHLYKGMHFETAEVNHETLLDCIDTVVDHLKHVEQLLLDGTITAEASKKARDIIQDSYKRIKIK